MRRFLYQADKAKDSGSTMSSKTGFFMNGRVGRSVAQAEEGSSADWELRPCGMLVQKRDPDTEAAHAGPLIRVKVSYGRASQYVSITAHSTFGELKKLLVQETGLQPKQQRLLYKGKEKSDRDCLQEVGVKDKSKIVLVEDTTKWEKRLVELRETDAAAKARMAVAEVQHVVDQISGQVSTIEAAVLGGRKLSDSDIVGPSDLLMSQLIKLDASKVDGDAKVQKRILIRRVQKYVETLDALKVHNDTLGVQHTGSRGFDEPAKVRSNAMKARTDGQADVSISQNNTVITTTWETFGSSTGHGNAKSALPASEPLLIQWD